MSNSEIIVCAYCKKPILAREAYMYTILQSSASTICTVHQESVKCVIGENFFKVRSRVANEYHLRTIL
jgi:hypothetical protein